MCLMDIFENKKCPSKILLFQVKNYIFILSMLKWMNIQYLKLFSAFQVLVRTKILCTHFSTSIANHPFRNSSFVHFFYIYFKKNPHFTFIPSCLFNQSKQKSTYACLFHPACLIKFDKNPSMHIYYIRSFIRYLRVHTYLI